MSFSVGISDPIYMLRTSQCLDRGSTYQNMIMKWNMTDRYFQMILQGQSELEVWTQWPMHLGFETPRLDGEWQGRAAFAISLSLSLFTKVLKSCALGGALHLHCHPRLGTPATPSKEEARERALSSLQPITLTLVGERENVAGKKMKMTQSVPALLYSQEQLDEIQEPMIPHPQLHVELSSAHLLMLRNLVEKLKTRHAHVSMKGVSNVPEKGTLQLMVQDASTIDIEFGPLSVPPSTLQHQSSQSPSPSVACPKVTVAAKDLYQCLQCQSLHPASIILGLLHESALVLYVHWPPAVLTFFLPAKRIDPM